MVVDIGGEIECLGHQMLDILALHRIVRLLRGMMVVMVDRR